MKSGIMQGIGKNVSHPEACLKLESRSAEINTAIRRRGGRGERPAAVLKACDVRSSNLRVREYSVKATILYMAASAVSIISIIEEA